MDGDEQFEQAAQGALVIIGRLNAVFQVGQTTFACPGMGVVEIRTVVQRPAFKHNGITFLADNGGRQRADCGQVRMVERRGKRHAVDVLRILFDSGVRDRQLRHLRMIEQSAIHVYAKKAHGLPSFKK